MCLLGSDDVIAIRLEVGLPVDIVVSRKCTRVKTAKQELICVKSVPESTCVVKLVDYLGYVLRQDVGYDQQEAETDKPVLEHLPGHLEIRSMEASIRFELDGKSFEGVMFLGLASFFGSCGPSLFDHLSLP